MCAHLPETMTERTHPDGNVFVRSHQNSVHPVCEEGNDGGREEPKKDYEA